MYCRRLRKTWFLQVISYSSGQLSDSDVIFDVVTSVRFVVEGMHIRCVVKNITESADQSGVSEDPSPVVIYTRDHHFDNARFNKVKVGDTVKPVIAKFELNDSYVSVIAELVEDGATKYSEKACN